MESELAALAASGATTLVGLMVSESWEQAKTRLARFLTRREGSAGSAEAAEEELQAASEAVGGARAVGDDTVVARAEEAWRLRLEEILRTDPGAARELRDLVAELGPRMSVSGSVTYGPAFQGSQVHGGITFQVQAQPAREPWAKPDQVPALTFRFVSRTNDIRALDDWFGSEGAAPVRIGAVDGLPGVGKTATVCRWSQRARDRFPDGQLYVDFAALRDLAGGDVSEAVAMCLRSLGVSEEFIPGSLAERAAVFRSATAGLRLLLVLDDVTQPAQVRPLIPKGPGSAVLVTSHGSLAELALDGARRLPLEPLDAEDGLALLADRCGQEAVDADRPAAERLVQLCGGLPVALQIVTGRLLTDRRTSMASLAAELEDETGRLGGMALRLPGNPRGERSVSTVLGSAYRLLDADAARFYRLLGWLPGRTFDAGTAAVAGDLDATDARRLLDVLEDANLLLRLEDDRYRMHDLVRLHAWERAVEEEAETEEVALAERVATHYLVLTAFADRALREDRLRIADLSGFLPYVHNPFSSAGAASPLEWLDAERANILAVLRTAVRLELHTPAWQLAEAFTALFLHRRYLGAWRESLELGAEAASAAVAPAAEARLRSLLSRPLMDLGEHQRAHDELRKAAACAEVAGHPLLSASVQEFLGRYGDRFDPEQAVAAYARSVSLNVHAGERRGAAIARYFLGCAQDARGAHRQALSTLRGAHAELSDLDDRRMAARALAAIGVVHDHLGDSVVAVHALREAAHLLREQEATYYEAQALAILADIAERMGGEEQASVRDWLARAADIHEAAGSPSAGALRERVRRLDDAR
ncbi:NB-ARC domain-containing protein [Streptomyces sp. NPDC088350]|uniref:NB-ARC domain-containing protein n=1 Tax=Streptomyces sp. NPDC088350 TaxID=3365854 RepID=UPI003811E5C9